MDVTYTVKSDMRAWDGSNLKKTLTSNVIVSDNLPTQATWNVDDASFITATGIELTKADPVAVAAFSGDEYVGKYFVDGQKLYVNIGMGTELNVSIDVKAKIHTVAKLGTNWTNVPGETKNKFVNRAQWSYADDAKRGDGYNNEVELVSFKDNEDGFNAADRFKKESVSKQIEVEPGQSTAVEYMFTVGQGKGIDLTKSTIVDYVDSNVYDLSDLDAIKASLTAKYE